MNLYHFIAHGNASQKARELYDQVSKHSNDHRIIVLAMLVKDMMAHKASERPTMTEVVSRLNEIPL